MSDKDPFAKAYQIALCQEIECGWFMVFTLPIPPGYVRISEPVTVNFTKSNSEAAVQEALKAIDALEREARNELNSKLRQLNDRRASLLSLTHQSDTP